MRITHVAIILEGVTYSLPAPNRHHHIFWKLHEEGQDDLIRGQMGTQGFLLDDGTFVDREQAAAMYPHLVKHAGQIFSEDLW